MTEAGEGQQTEPVAGHASVDHDDCRNGEQTLSRRRDRSRRPALPNQSPLRKPLQNESPLRKSLQNESSLRAPDSVAFSRRLRALRPRAVVESLGLIGLAAAALSPAGELVAANLLFEALVPDVVQTLSGRMRLTEPVARRQFDDAVARLKFEAYGGSVRPIAVGGRSGTPPVILQLVPLRGTMLNAHSSAASVLVTVRAELRPTPSPHILQRLFGLSPAESRVAFGIAKCQTVGAIAESSGVSRETVRSQLKTVLAKTGTRRQLDLAVLLAGLQVPSG
jgi:DNA-binding CsgD family transcriptional regulator